MIKPICITILLIFHFTMAIAQNPKVVSSETNQQVGEWIAEANVPRIAIAFIEDGKIAQEITMGKDLNGKAITSTTIFDVASLTKTITTVATMKLVEKEGFDLEEPLYHYWIDPDVQEDLRHRKLTATNTLSHQSGFKNWRYMYEDQKLAFEFEPGENFQYSGEGFEYLRNALERKFDASFENLVDTLVFNPVRMHHSSLVWNSEMEQLDFAGAHDKEGKAYDYHKSYESNAADNLLTTLEDFSKLALALLHDNYLDPALKKTMSQPYAKVNEGINFGLGWTLFENLSNGEYALFNSGSDQGVNSLVILLPSSQRGLVVLTNGDNGRDPIMKAIKTFLGEQGIEMLTRFE